VPIRIEDGRNLTEFGSNEINRVFGQAYDLQFELDRAESPVPHLLRASATVARAELGRQSRSRLRDSSGHGFESRRERPHPRAEMSSRVPGPTRIGKMARARAIRSASPVETMASACSNSVMSPTAITGLRTAALTARAS